MGPPPTWYFSKTRLFAAGNRDLAYFENEYVFEEIQPIPSFSLIKLKIARITSQLPYFQELKQKHPKNAYF